MTYEITAPEPIKNMHDANRFDCGVASLNEWIKKRALRNEGIGGSRTYVVCHEGVVIGYYALAVGSVEHKQVSSNLRRNMPEPIPVMILGRLAVDQKYRNQKLGSLLLRDAILKTLQASKIAGIKAMMVEAISDKAKEFYQKRGFRCSPIDERLLFITIDEATRSL